MRQDKSYSPNAVIIITFLICFIIRFIDAFLLRMDETVLNENFIHKLSGILILAVVLIIVNLSWKDIGFDFKKFLKPTLLGLGLGAGRFALAYGLEYIILLLQGKEPAFEFSLRSFSVDGSHVQLPAYSIMLAFVFNIINAVMEEGVFRGFFIRYAKTKYRFAVANVVAALLFGVWHITMPIRSWIDGTMSLQNMLVYSIGYIIFSGSMALVWGMLLEMSGLIWIGLADHFFNNTVINLLHIKSNSGFDQLQIARALVAQLIAIVVVTVIYIRKCKQ